MVQFGKELEKKERPEWKRYYIHYKVLKKKIKHFAALKDVAPSEEKRVWVASFSAMLDKEIEKTVLFMIEQQGVLASRLQAIADRRDAMSSDEEFDRVPALLEEYRQVGRDLVQLLIFLDLNATGLRKILKKFGKQVGMSINQQYIQSRIEHPYSQLQQVFRNVGVLAMVGTIAQHIAELKQKIEQPLTPRTMSSFSLFQQQSRPLGYEEEPVIKAIEEVRAKLTRTVSITSFLANAALMPTAEAVAEVEYHLPSVYLHQLNTFLYMVNYYIVVPSSDLYAEMLGVPATLCGVIIGSMPVTALISAVVYSWWSNYTYTAPLVVSTVVLFCGNLMYALALNLDSVWLCLIGRALCGLGGARAINRRYIADQVPLKERNAASAMFVSASALGMACGPALAGLLNHVDFKVAGIIVNFVTAPGWLMALSWMIYMVLLLALFKEPQRPPMDASIRGADIFGSGRRSPTAADIEDNGDLHAPLLSAEDEGGLADVGCSYQETLSDDDESGGNTKAPGKSKAVETLSDLRQELTEPVLVMLLIYFMVKFTNEVLVSESGIVTKFFFNWKPREIGVFLALLGLLVIPISTFVGTYITNRFDERMVIVWAEVLTGLSVVAIFNYGTPSSYSVLQYILASVIMFVSSNVLEGVAGALLSKIMSPRLSRGTFNCGLLSTEAGTLARAFADAMITIFGYLGTSGLLNRTMVPTLLVCIWCTVETCRHYHILF